MISSTKPEVSAGLDDMKKAIILVILLSVALSAGAQGFLDQSLSPEIRARDLVSRLTLEEKAALATNDSKAVERLGIKGYNWWNEALHGVGFNGQATSFPEPIGMAASFDAPLVYEVFQAISDEGRVKFRQARQEGEIHVCQGITFWTPNINIFRDPRWGRGMETYGEDPFLTGQMGMAVVRGLQGDPDAPVLKAFACAKHFAVHSGPESERHKIDVCISDRDLLETYLPAFKDLVTKAQVQEIMTAYNRFRGVPCAANPYLIDGLLRGDWGFKGIVTSDCWALRDFYEPGKHEYLPGQADAVAAAIKAGVDLECGDAYHAIPEAVERGLLNEKDLDRNLERLFAARIRFGEFDDIDPWADLPDSLIECEKHLSLARKMACESIVLLQNKDGILPLDKGRKIALIGPNSDHARMMLGNYAGEPEKAVSLKDAMERMLPGLTCFSACGLMDSHLRPEGWEETFTFAPRMEDSEILDRLDGIDTVVFAGGLSYCLEAEEAEIDLPGFKGGDRTDIELPSVQRNLLKMLHDAGKKVILVNFSGSAMGLGPETETCDAILQAWYPGQEGGPALCDILFGQVCPSGKLPVTFYKSADQLPDFRDYGMKGRTYRYFAGETLFPFGFGLSYTQIQYLKVKVRRGRLIVKMRNVGERDTEEIIQLYVRKLDDAEGPSRTLRGFRRIPIKAGRKKKVCFDLTPETFLWWSETAGDMVPLPGVFEISVGGNSSDTKSVEYRFKG